MRKKEAMGQRPQGGLGRAEWEREGGRVGEQQGRGRLARVAWAFEGENEGGREGAGVGVGQKNHKGCQCICDQASWVCELSRYRS